MPPPRGRSRLRFYSLRAYAVKSVVRRELMTNESYDRAVTALLVVDPYNDFISEGGKIWPRIKAIAEANGCVPHMLEVLTAARKAKLPIFYATGPVAPMRAGRIERYLKNIKRREEYPSGRHMYQ
jgi:hypothetical protein